MAFTSVTRLCKKQPSGSSLSVSLFTTECRRVLDTQSNTMPLTMHWYFILLPSDIEMLPVGSGKDTRRCLDALLEVVGQMLPKGILGQL